MSNLAFDRPGVQRWPMTSEAFHELAEELARLRAAIGALADASTDDERLLSLDLVRSARRLDMLTSVFDDAQQDDDPTRAVIGRHTTVLEDGADLVTYSLVYPGEGDPANGRISADSPMGSAILGACAGDSVDVVAPAGRRVVTIMAVEPGNVCSAP